MTSRRRRMTAHMSPHSAARRPRQARADFRAGARRAALRLVFLVVTAAPAVHAQQALIAPLEADGPVTYHIAEGAPGSMYRESDRELARWALEAWRKAAGGAIELAEAPEDEALVRIYFVPASAGQYGEMRPILVNGRRGAEVYVRPDVRALGPDIAAAALADPLLRDSIVYLTCVHELGHAFGLEHTADYADIMYFFGYGGDVLEFFRRYREQLGSRGDIANVSGLSAGDAARIEALYVPDDGAKSR